MIWHVISFLSMMGLEKDTRQFWCHIIYCSGRILTCPTEFLFLLLKKKKRKRNPHIHLPALYRSGIIQEFIWCILTKQCICRNFSFKMVCAHSTSFCQVEAMILGEVQDLPKGIERENRIIQTIMRQLLFALDGLHSTGIVHRDIKPQNIIFSQGWFRIQVVLVHTKLENMLLTSNNLVPLSITLNRFSYIQDHWSWCCCRFASGHQLYPQGVSLGSKVSLFCYWKGQSDYDTFNRTCYWHKFQHFVHIPNVSYFPTSQLLSSNVCIYFTPLSYLHFLNFKISNLTLFNCYSCFFPLGYVLCPRDHLGHFYSDMLHRSNT